MREPSATSSSVPLFEVVDPNGHSFQIFSDGSAIGFPEGSVISNGVAPRLALTLGLVIRARSLGRITEEEAATILGAWEQRSEEDVTNEASAKHVLASGAGPGGHGAPLVGAVGSLKDGLHLTDAVKTRLTDVVLGLRADFIAGPARHWDGICSICELSGNELDKRVTTALREGFFKFSQLLCGLEVILLQGHQFGVVREETLLGLEKLFVHADDDFVQFVGVADLDCRFSDVECSAQRGDGASDQGQVHTGSPNVEKGGVGASDSTLRGNPGDGGGHG